MKRTIYDEDHEAFRESVKEFLDRQVVPHLEEYAEAHALPREFWIEAGKQGLLGLEVPEGHRMTAEDVHAVQRVMVRIDG